MSRQSHETSKPQSKMSLRSRDKYSEFETNRN